MGQHKTNPTAILAKEGKIKPKEKQEKWTKNEVLNMVYQRMGLEPYEDFEEWLETLSIQEGKNE